MRKAVLSSIFSQAHGHPVPERLLKKWDEIEDFAVKFQMRVIAPNRLVLHNFNFD